jgi:hypothetical protein
MSNTYIFAAVGFRFRGKTPKVLREAAITLELEPNNQYDDKAVKVLVANDHVGYVSKEHSSAITRIL